MKYSQDSIVGTWLLVSFELRFEDGSKSFPWGPSVRGQVIYGEDGYMAGALMKEGRSKFSTEDVMGGTPEEFSEAMKSYIGYCGPYEYTGERVIHHAEVSLFPNWTGSNIERFVQIQGETLTLSTPTLLFGGKRGTANLIWKRAPERVK